MGACGFKHPPISPSLCFSIFNSHQRFTTVKVNNGSLIATVKMFSTLTVSTIIIVLSIISVSCVRRDKINCAIVSKRIPANLSAHGL